MPLIEIDSVIQVSSEDSLYPARNLISSAIGNNVKKWLIEKKGEKQAHILFKLKEKANITNVTIGNENSAFIEILVGDENMSEKEFQVLLPATEIQTLRETRAGLNKNGVHFFKKDDLDKELARKEWSRVKVVCSQPYDPHCRFGLNCFVMKSIKMEDSGRTPDKSPKKKPSTVKVERKDLESDDTKNDVNSWKQDVLKRLDSGSAEASTSSSLPFNRMKLNNQRLSDNQQSTSSTKLSTSAEPGGRSNKNDVKEEEVEDEEERKAPVAVWDPDAAPKSPSPSSPPKPARPKIEFGRILQDVRFSLSGYENPLRSEIRNKGLAMGAKYSNDWDSRCTHLICAFINTPKFNKVQGQGKIVTQHWIEQCHSKRRRLPWRKFALDKRDRQQPISEEDEEEEEEKIDKETKKKNSQTKGDRRRRLPSDSSSDTEDEIQRVQARKQRNAAKAVVTNGDGAIQKRNGNATKTRDDLYNAETDVSSDEDGDIDLDNSDADPDFKIGSQEAPSELDESFGLDVDETASENEAETENESDDEPKKKKPKKVKINKPDRAKKKRVVQNADTSLRARVAGSLLSDDDDDNDKGSLNKNDPLSKGMMSRPDTTRLQLPSLPHIPPHTYYIAEDEKGAYREYLIRYIAAFDGTISDVLSNSVEYAITDSKNIAGKIVKNFPTVVVVKSEWIWDSFDADKLLSTEKYHLSS